MTTSVSSTLRVSPALVPATVRLYVPPGVGLPVPPPALVSGINLEAPHPAIARAPHTTAIPQSRRSLLRLNPSNPNGRIPASHIHLRSPGSRSDATFVATVTVIAVVPPRLGVAGLTVQVAFAGAAAHENTTVPGTPATERQQ